MTASSSNLQTTSIHPETEVGHLSLAVANLERSIAFYTDAIGFALLQQDADGATLGAAGRPLLHLSEHADASPWPRDRTSYTGLYHFAILLPTRADLGLWLRHWLDFGYGLPGQGDHLVSEALYLEDPDGNGIEVYRDRPRDQWQFDQGQVRMATDPVDIKEVLAEAARSGNEWNGLPEGTQIGHVHLQVGDIEGAERFYREVLGFDIMVSMPTALFMSAGGYHHHLGLNIWHSRGSGPAPEGTAGLRFFTLVLPSDEARRAVVSRVEAAGLPATQQGDDIIVQDPWQNTIRLQVAGASAAQQHN